MDLNDPEQRRMLEMYQKQLLEEHMKKQKLSSEPPARRASSKAQTRGKKKAASSSSPQNSRSSSSRAVSATDVPDSDASGSDPHVDTHVDGETQLRKEFEDWKDRHRAQIQDEDPALSLEEVESVLQRLWECSASARESARSLHSQEQRPPQEYHNEEESSTHTVDDPSASMKSAKSVKSAKSDDDIDMAKEDETEAGNPSSRSTTNLKRKRSYGRPDEVDESPSSEISKPEGSSSGPLKNRSKIEVPKKRKIEAQSYKEISSEPEDDDDDISDDDENWEDTKVKPTPQVPRRQSGRLKTIPVASKSSHENNIGQSAPKVVPKPRATPPTKQPKPEEPAEPEETDAVAADSPMASPSASQTAVLERALEIAEEKFSRSLKKAGSKDSSALNSCSTSERLLQHTQTAETESTATETACPVFPAAAESNEENREISDQTSSPFSRFKSLFK